MTMWIGYARAGREFEVQQELRDMGITAWVARKIEAIRRGKNRWPEVVITPTLPNYLFIEASANEYQAIKSADIKFLASTFAMVPTKSIEHTCGPKCHMPCKIMRLRRFMSEQDAEFIQRKAKIDAGERVSEYERDDPFEILSGPLQGCIAKFRRIMETQHDPFPRIQGQTEFMGQTVLVEVDPIDARRVAKGA